MKKTLLSLMLVVTIGSQGQSYLTNGQVYNFDVGDTMQMSLYRPAVSMLVIAYVTDVVIGKSLTTGSTTIQYTVRSTTYTPPSTFSTSIYTETITNLNAAASQDNNSEQCCQLHDSIFTNNCGHTVWQLLSEWQCEGEQRDVTQEDTYLVEGLGGPYYSYVTTADGFVPSIYNYQLVFYSKAAGRCGSLVTSVQDITRDPGFAIYPNPSNGQFSITHNGLEKFNIQIADLNGKLVVAQSLGNTNSVDASQLNQGVYNLIISKPGYSFNKKLVIVH